MLGKKTVVKFNDGKIIKGYTTDFNPNRELFHVSLANDDQQEGQGEQVEVSVNDIKAVFFVKDFQGDKEYQKVRTFN
ncbi:MAG TPA: hypothetical protein VJ958_00790, partial [Atribacterota bacterium]|nr:hypothetical protein [Atribacterota bacterium]